MNVGKVHNLPLNRFEFMVQLFATYVMLIFLGLL